MPDLLDDADVTEALSRLPGWTGGTAALCYTVDLPDFRTAITVVDEVAAIAEQRDHHPDIDIRWRTLTFSCATHSTGGVTANDVELAASITAVVDQHGGEVSNG
ncbi:MAG: 4a-hydroxytetrahydrobiopterin dehydratase [Mycobacteriales bacterium]|nr:MAG: 4a-hydroxytetrahydrobiopterin dehydratase [Pseudonocardiales bacterium]